MFVNTSETFSKSLIRYRKRRGLSQRELAKHANLTQRMINRYENNPGSVPVEKLDAIAIVLNVSIADLFGSSKNSPLDEFDVRWLKKLSEIKTLPQSKQKEIIRNINTFLENNRLKQEHRNLL